VTATPSALRILSPSLLLSLHRTLRSRSSHLPLLNPQPFLSLRFPFLNTLYTAFSSPSSLSPSMASVGQQPYVLASPTYSRRSDDEDDYASFCFCGEEVEPDSDGEVGIYCSTSSFSPSFSAHIIAFPYIFQLAFNCRADATEPLRLPRMRSPGRSFRSLFRRFRSPNRPFVPYILADDFCPTSKPHSTFRLLDPPQFRIPNNPPSS
jgi:hypothetical protein